MGRTPKPLWNPYVAGAFLGFALLLTFVMTGHGLGASGFMTNIAAAGSSAVAPVATADNGYFSHIVGNGRNPLNSWITWEIIGVILGALGAAIWSGRFRWKVDGPTLATSKKRIVLALIGGTLSGFGARVSLGCTSGLGLSGAAVLASAGFLFLVGFFIAGSAAGLIMRRYW
ncbi:MAG: transporter [Nevskiaceae bacterium]|nr:MAG: transporter [Nevskiaceae bacterium]TBR73189.1 MAG: transporter [Nevskiaceae bacterium]